MDVLACRAAAAMVLIAVCLASVSARADAGLPLPPAQGAALDAGGPQPPELIGLVEAPYPEEARALGVEGTVGLDITLDATGQVTAVDVREPAGHGFDEAARAAALQFRFKPASQNGQPIPSRVRYPFVFKLPPPPAVVVVRVVRGGAPVAGAQVQLTAPDGTVSQLDTDGEGIARSGPLAPGAYALEATTRDDPGSATLQVELTPGELPVDLTLPPKQPRGVVDVTVRGGRSEGQRLQRSAEAVNVVDTRRAKQRTADLGEVLARTQGVAIRRDGGLGSSTRFSLNGLYDLQIRFFLDGVPLGVAGYPFDVANVPVNLIDRVDIYRGVVPVRFGADALGGALNLVTDQSYESHAGVSYQRSSFDTDRVTVNGRWRHQPTGFVVGVSAFGDKTDSDYHIDVEIPDERGRPAPARVKRFHDAYRAWGTTLELGVVDRPWAKRLLVRGVATGYRKELQHNVVMKVPYGEVTHGSQVYGGNVRYEVDLHRQLGLELITAYSRQVIDYTDKSSWVYNWRGDRILMRRVRGEIDNEPTDQTSWQDNLYARALLKYEIDPQHVLRLSVSPAFTGRTGNERIQPDPSARDPLTADRKLFTLVSGLEYELNLFGDRLQNMLFVKDYVYRADSEEPLPGGVFRDRDRETHSWGIGDSLRYRFTSWFYAKASYEYATRLPQPWEVFGDGVLVNANLALEPEVSHNANLGPRFELRRPWLGYLLVDVNAFLRYSDKLIVQLFTDQFSTYQNVYTAHGYGLENAVSWESPGRWFSSQGSFTWQDIRNASSRGTFGAFDGDRIPNRPYMFGSWGASLRFPKLPSEDDTLSPYYDGRYVHAFFRGWESQGLREWKQVVDRQITHNVGVVYNVERDQLKASLAFEVNNVTDAKVFDNFGVQRPGRWFGMKLTGDI